MEKQPPIEQAIQNAGGLTAFAHALGETRQAVNQWRVRGQVPANKTLAAERVSGVSRRLLRPDDWADYWPEVQETAKA